MNSMLFHLFNFFVPIRLYTWATSAVVAYAAISAYSANASANAQNRASENAKLEAKRRYALQSGIAKNQMEEQNSIAMSKMTDVSREFLKAKGKAKVIQAESLVTGNTAKRINSITRNKFSEAKGKVAKETDTNVINIAQGMLANKIDTESIIAQAEARKQNVGLNTVIAGIQGGLQGYSLGSQIKGSVSKPSSDFGTDATQLEKEIFG